MRTFQQIGQLRAYLRGFREEGKTVGFVPTMGALHDGHLSLIRRAKDDCDIALISIFVNPLQFNDPADLEAYPRDAARDMQCAAKVGADATFVPEPSEMYPPGFQTVVDVPEIGSVLEGASRPGHFRGVATIVTKLLNAVLPDRVYFGQKDYQQCLLVERMVRDLNMPVTVVMMPTVREADGLAMSSRNARLSPPEREAATALSKALQMAEEMLRDGVMDAQVVCRAVEQRIEQEPLAVVDYVAVVDADTLKPRDSLAESAALVAVAARIGNTRLIDNVLIAPPGVVIPRVRSAKS